MARKSRFIATAVGADAPVAPNTLYRLRVELSPHETVRNLDQFGLDYCCMPQERGARGWLHALARGAQVTAMRKAGRTVEVLANAEEEGRRMQKMLTRGNRFAKAADGGASMLSGVGTLI